MHRCLFAQPVFHLHPWDLAFSVACARNTRAIAGLIAQVGSPFAVCALHLLPVERVGTPGFHARVA
jgi:hypothetical protein